MGTLRLSLAEFLHNGESFGVLSSWDDSKKHQAATLEGQLTRDLKVLGYQFLPYSGSWATRGRAYLVWDIEPLDLFVLGRKYHQKSVIFKSRNVAGSYSLGDFRVDVAVLTEGGVCFGSLPWNGKAEISAIIRQRFLES